MPCKCRGISAERELGLINISPVAAEVVQHHRLHVRELHHAARELQYYLLVPSWPRKLRRRGPKLPAGAGQSRARRLNGMQSWSGVSSH
eukprot:COSAG01_NODE_17467_length_1149_cov_1.544762_3_plen_89_part_00